MERTVKQKRNLLTFCTAATLSAVWMALVVIPEAHGEANTAAQTTQKIIELPAPKLDGSMSLEKALATRRSIRQFTGKEFTMEQISRLAWSGQGITEKTRGLRTAPSARASYPMTLYLITQSGLYMYLPQKHALQVQEETDLRQKIAGRQNSIAKSGCTFVIASKVGSSTAKYGERAEKWKVLEAGHIAQNILLEATSMGLGAVPIGAYDPNAVGQVCKMPADMEPVYLVAAGYPAEQKASEPGPKPAKATPAVPATGEKK